jgi:hypothetical protein
MTSCKKATEYMLQAEEKKLSPWQRLMLWQHQRVCVLCRRFGLQNNTINTALQKTYEPHIPRLSNDDKSELITQVAKRAAASD